MSGLPARSVIVLETVAAKSAGSDRLSGFEILTISDLPSAASVAVDATLLPPALSWTDVFDTVAAATGSEKVTTIGSARLTERLPRVGTTLVT